jgi:acyl-CoA thioester hydrolase
VATRRKFNHSVPLQVRNYEVDWQGIVHNAVYLQYFEIGRMEYLKRIGVRVDLHSIVNESKVVVARNEVDYRSSSTFG